MSPLPPPRTKDQVLDYLMTLKPSGWLWQGAMEDDLRDMLEPLADAIATVEASAAQMLVEIDPGAAVNLLTDYLRVLGPDPAQRDLGSPTQSELQAIARQRWTLKAGATPTFFEGLGLGAGIPVCVVNYSDPPPRCGVAICGSGAVCMQDPEQYKWLVTVSAAYLALAQELFASFVPAHTEPVYFTV